MVLISVQDWFRNEGRYSTGFMPAVGQLTKAGTSLPSIREGGFGVIFSSTGKDSEADWISFRPNTRMLIPPPAELSHPEPRFSRQARRSGSGSSTCRDHRFGSPDPKMTRGIRHRFWRLLISIIQPDYQVLETIGRRPSTPCRHDISWPSPPIPDSLPATP